MFVVFNYLFLSAFTLLCILPFILVFMVSITDESVVAQEGYRLIPQELSLEAYKFMFQEGSRVAKAYKITTTVTVVGTFLSVLSTSLLAYVLANRRLRYRNHISFFVFFTMLFSGGLVPWYLVVVGLGLRNTIWAMILPPMIAAWFVFLLRTFFQSIPDSIPESARVDGASELRIYFQLMIPLAIPGIATIALFYAIGYWNDWWHAILFVIDGGLYPLQLFLRIILSDISQAVPTSVARFVPVPQESVRMATMIVTIGPIILVYPFAQRFFIRGIIVGAIKG